MMQRDFIPTVSFHLVIKPIRIILCTLHWILLLFIVFRSTADAWIPRCCRSPTGFPGSRVAGSTNRFSSIYYRIYDSSESLKRQKLNSYRFTLIRSTERNTERVDTGEVWHVGNVDDDFKNLEREIMYSNADQNLLHEERVEALNYFAQQRIPIASVMRKSLMIPLMASFVISHFLHMLIDHKHIPRTLHAMAFICQQFIRCISLAQFLSVVVVAPAVLLGLILHKKRKINAATPEDPMEPISEHFDNLQYLVAKSKSIDNKRALPSSSTRDYVQCLLEQWISCTFGMSLSGFIWFVASIVKPGSVQISPCGVLFLQLLTRFGVMSSLQQYQSIWFALTRKQQPCPLPWLIWATQTLATNALNVWFVVLDVVSLSLLSPALRHILPAMVASTVLLWYSVILLERLMMKASSVDQAQYRFKTSKLLTQMQQLCSFCTKAFFAWSFWNCGPMMSKAFQRLWFASTRGTPLARRIAWSNVVSIFSIAVAIVGPVCHLLATQKLIHISYSHNTSLAIKSDQFDKTTLLPNGDESWKWRYKLRWREPQRVHTTLRKWWDDFWYVLFFRGSVDEKLRQDQQRRLRENGAKARGLTVLQKVAAEDPLMNPSGNDRTQWKIKAMERIAQKHQEDYSIGSFDDPLGVAVHRTLGIGLGFNFDHIHTVNSTKTPSIRRLQARAAKSAIRRVNDIYNANQAATELNKITDPMKRQQRATALRQEAEVEVKKLADMLTELVPTDLKWDVSESELQIEQYQASNYLGSPKQKKYKIPSMESESPALRQLFKNYTGNYMFAGESFEIDYLNPMGSNDLSSDDEFLAEWYRTYKGSKQGDTNHSDDGENVITTILV